MRILTALGGLVFGYLTIIPAGLIGAQLDSSCAGAGCESSPLLTALLVGVYLASALALFGTAALMVDHTLRGTHASQERIAVGLTASGAAIGITAFVLLATAEPVGAAVIAVIGAATYLWLRYLNRARPEPNPSTNGHRPEPPQLRP
ncbi:MAG: hypothetical protein ACR2K6_01570 [Solirubrobacterales bacterium]